MTQEQTPTGERARASAGLVGTLGAPQIVFMVVAMAAPLTVVAGLIPIMFAVGNGVGVPLDFVVIGAVLLLFTVGFSAMTPEVEDAGAFYSYVHKGMGTVAGFGAAALAIVTYLVLLVSVSAYLGAAARSTLATVTGMDLPWWSLAAACLLAVAFLGFRNIEMSAKVLGALLVAEMLIVAVLDLAIVIKGGDHGLSTEPFSREAFTSGAVSTGIMFAVFGFIGFEATAVFRSEARDPDRTIPRATYAAVILIGAVYAFTAWALVAGAGADQVVALAGGDPVSFTPDLTSRYVSHLAHDAIQVLLATSFFACVLTVHNVVSRYLFTLGRQGALPVRFGTPHPRHGSPYVASVVTSVVASVALGALTLAGLDPVLEIYAWLGGAGTLGLVVLLTLTSVAVVVHFRRSPGRVSAWRGTLAPGIASVSLTAILFLVIRNFELLVGSRPIAQVLLAVIAAAWIGGLAWGLRIRTRAPRVLSRTS